MVTASNWITLFVFSAGVVIAILGGLYGLIQKLIMSRYATDMAALKELVLSVKGEVSGVARDVHRLDLRMTKLEAEHNVGHCRFKPLDE